MNQLKKKIKFCFYFWLVFNATVRRISFKYRLRTAIAFSEIWAVKYALCYCQCIILEKSV